MDANGIYFRPAGSRLFARAIIECLRLAGLLR